MLKNTFLSQSQVITAGKKKKNLKCMLLHLKSQKASQKWQCIQKPTGPNSFLIYLWWLQ